MDSLKKRKHDQLKRQKFKQIVISFTPEILWNPVFLCESSLRSKIINAIKSFAISTNEKWLDVGCGTRPYEQHFPLETYVGVDVETSGRDLEMKSADYFYDGNILPFASGTFDGVISTQVLEHVPNPRALLNEINRVIKPGGGLVLSIPFMWQEHEEPFDFSRFTSFGMTELLNQNGFNIVSIEKDVGALESLAVVLNVYIAYNLIPPIPGLGSLIALLVGFPLQTSAWLLQKILPDRKQLYLNLIVRAKKVNCQGPL
jgi:SAM-dependent methyltransferase